MAPASPVQFTFSQPGALQVVRRSGKNEDSDGKCSAEEVNYPTCHARQGGNVSARHERGGI